MADGNSLINLGDISKPVTVLIERVSDAVGGVFKPAQIVRTARAEAEASKIRALADIEITEIQQRALQRMIVEEGKRQQNIEDVLKKTIPQLKDDAAPEKIEGDWLTNFFDKSRLYSDEEMQLLWSRILAGEANTPGTYSKRTVNLLSSLDKKDAIVFQKLLRFGWRIGNVVPLVFDVLAPIYNGQGINFNTLTHLDEIGLISYSGPSSIDRLNLPKDIRLFYYGKPVDIHFDKEAENKLDLGKVMLSKSGQELAPICDCEPLPDFYDYVIEYWITRKNLSISIPLKMKT